ncbi:MAG TPA: NAD-dependent epimerase/dehydratase family protein [Thermoanaerobaculia bacterium]|jgi:UDP-glucose 4-epimerase
MKAFITGAAGFIGSNLADRLLADGHQVTGYDNLSTGQERFLEIAQRSSTFHLVRGDLLDLGTLTAAMAGSDSVFHLAANADVRFGLQHPGKDVEQNTLATFHVLEAMRANGVKRIAFSSTGSVYGEAEVIPTPETAPFPIQTSLYGASKLAGEGLIQAYCEGFGFEGYIFRFVSILGERYSHGHVFDFYKSLLSNPHELTVLGNGKQRKSYLYIQDCIDAILTALAHPSAKVHVYNLGVDEFVEVNDSVGWITQHLGLSPKLSYTGGDRGWVGDNPFIFLDCSKVRSLGWRPKVSIAEGIIKTLDYLQSNQWLLEARS